MRTCFTLLLALGVALPAWAQPNTDVYLAPLIHTADSVQVGPLLNISNHNGYDNQPQFEPDSRSLLFTSDRTPPADIYRYIIDGKILTQVTKTEEAEYSPKPIPLTRDFATIRVEADGTQRIWRFDEHGNSPTLEFPEEDSLGYYAWLDSTYVLAFKLGDPPLLRQISLAGRRSLNRAHTIGRGFNVVPGKPQISYVLKRGEGWMVRYLQPHNGRDRRITYLPEGVEDFDWFPDGSGLIVGKDSTLHVWTETLDTWKPVHTFDGITNITRVDVSPDGQWLALVAEPATADPDQE
ncbi:MAG: hypothetical protein RhofKO_43390 [Rhodothermales bacterium]